MPSRKHFGFVYFFLYILYLFLNLFHFFLIIRAPVPSLITLPSPHIPKTSIFNIILSALILTTVLSVPTGYLPPTCLPTYSQNLFLCLFSLNIEIHLVLLIFDFYFFPFILFFFSLFVP